MRLSIMDTCNPRLDGLRDLELFQDRVYVL